MIFPKLYLFLLFIGISQTADADFFKTRRNLKNHYKMGVIRVFYDTEGKHAVQPKDSNKNRVPDQVEDIAKQTWVAYQIFVESLEFPDPLKSERYNLAKSIDINILSKEVIGMNGMAYDGLLKMGRNIDKKGVKTICFDVASSVLAQKNITPAHELFHLIQNGCTFFKTRWYTEGMARWSEHALGKGSLGAIKYKSNGPWPQNKEMLEKLYRMKYDAEFYIWNPLADQSDPKGTIPSDKIQKEVREMKYSDGTKILKDTRLKGACFMRDVLLELGKLDDLAYTKLSYSKWSEVNQQSLDNSPYIYQAILNVSKAHKIKVQSDILP